MDSLTIRVSRSTHGVLRELADQTGEAMTDIVARAVRDYQQRRFWEEYHAAYAAIHADPSALADFQAEIEAWDSTSADGLEGPANGDDAADRPVAG